MRELKFRCFNKTKNKYVYSDEFDGEQTLNLYFFFKYIEDMKCCGDEFLHTEQFTGLEDKNGKDIYEGDILQYERVSLSRLEIGKKIVKSEFFTEIVMFSETTFEDCYRNEYSFLGWSIDPDSLNSREIIGNIHESPELMENK